MIGTLDPVSCDIGMAASGQTAYRPRIELRGADLVPFRTVSSSALQFRRSQAASDLFQNGRIV
jgi:hypothetical protein